MSKQINGFYDRLLNTVLGDMEDGYKSSVHEVFKLKTFPCNNNRKQTVARGSSSHPECNTPCIDNI